MKDSKGVAVLKRWRFITSNKRMYEALSALRCKHEKGFQHATLQGGAMVKASAHYPAKLCRNMLSSPFGWYEHTFCMPCVPVKDTGHREKNDVPSTPIDCACAPLGCDLGGVGIRLRTPHQTPRLQRNQDKPKGHRRGQGRSRGTCQSGDLGRGGCLGEGRPHPMGQRHKDHHPHR